MIALDLSNLQHPIVYEVTFYYAKFGEADKNKQQSNMAYFEGLIDLLQGKEEAAKLKFDAAVKLYPGNIWAQKMKE